jgi:hypothetical protein
MKLYFTFTAFSPSKAVRLVTFYSLNELQLDCAVATDCSTRDKSAFISINGQ